MTDRKITEGNLGSGPLRKIINKEARTAHLSEQGRKRVAAALKAGVEAEQKKFGLQLGVGERHADALEKFPTSKKYSDRRFLKPKEREVIKDTLNVFFKRKSVEPEIAEKSAPPDHHVITPPSVSSKIRSEESISAKKEEGSER